MDGSILYFFGHVKGQFFDFGENERKWNIDWAYFGHKTFRNFLIDESILDFLSNKTDFLPYFGQYADVYISSSHKVNYSPFLSERG